MENIVIIRAELKDAKAISDITEYWVMKGKVEEKDKGYLREKGIYNEGEIINLINYSLVTVAKYEGEVVSFYLINNVYHLDLIEERKKLIQDKINNKILPLGRYAYSLLASTDERFLGKGLNTQTLNLLKEIAKDEYDYFIGIMGYDNLATQKSSLKMGWKHFCDVGNGLLAVIGTTEERNDRLITNI